jgi:hypothetical protein
MKRHRHSRNEARHSNRVRMPGSDSASRGAQESRMETMERLRLDAEANLWMHRPIR